MTFFHKVTTTSKQFWFKSKPKATEREKITAMIVWTKNLKPRQKTPEDRYINCKETNAMTQTENAYTPGPLLVRPPIVRISL